MMKYFLFGLFLLVPLVLHASILKKKLDLMIKEYQENAEFKLEKIPVKKDWNDLALELTGEKFLSKYILFSPLFVDSKLSAYLVVEKAMGKGAPFIIAIIYNTDRTIDYCTVLQDISPHGYKLNRKSFIEQFRGKGVSDSIKVHQDIDGISGSSYSVRGFCRAVWRINSIASDIFD